MHIGSWAIVLSVFWLLLSGYFQPLLLIFGVVSVLVVVLTVKRMDTVDQELKELKFGLSILKYVPWLLKEIVTSAMDVTKLVWGPKAKLAPALSKIPVDQVPANKHVLFANSITLTPGTLCVDLDDKEVTVHALNKSSIDALHQGHMSEKINKLWGRQS